MLYSICICILCISIVFYLSSFSFVSWFFFLCVTIPLLTILLKFLIFFLTKSMFNAFENNFSNPRTNGQKKKIGSQVFPQENKFWMIPIYIQSTLSELLMWSEGYTYKTLWTPLNWTSHVSMHFPSTNINCGTVLLFKLNC